MKKRALVWFAAALGCAAAAGLLIATRRLSPTPAPSGPAATLTDVMGPAEALDFTPSIDDGSTTLKTAYNAKEIQKAGGIGLSNQIMRDLINLQEQAAGGVQNAGR